MLDTVLHICSYYPGQRLYGNLIRELSHAGIAQHIYIPVRTAEEVGKYQIKDLSNVSFHYAYVLKPWHRFLYFAKIRKTFKVLQQNTNLSSFKLTHAHSLFTDGGVALKINERFNIPYIVAVRNTDINVFLRKMPHLRPFALKVLKKAKAIVFINPTYKDRLFNQYIPKEEQRILLSKCVCIPNGIDDFWLANRGLPKKFKMERLHLLYVGTFIRRKHLPLAIEAAKRLNEKYKILFTIIGGGGDAGVGEGHDEVIQAIESAKKSDLTFDIVGKLNNQEKLKEYYRKADIFVMPSKNETFGLVYIESISQGTPIIYTLNDGVGGIFKEGQVGYGIKSFSVDEIEKGVEIILSDYQAISRRCIEESVKYNWSVLVKEYLNLYNS